MPSVNFYEILPMKFIFIFFVFISSFVVNAESSQDKTVLIAILARNKAHVLPQYLRCIENLDYDKKCITIYINTNNNKDETVSLLRDFVKNNKDQYASIEMEEHEVAKDLSESPHDWTFSRTSVLSEIRNKSLRKAKELCLDYYFVIDCDNFVTPPTLKDMVLENKPIIAPMLTCFPATNGYSNFFYETDPNGYWKGHPLFEAIGNRSIIGTFKVPLVHCTYLIDARYIDKLSYSMDKDTFYEFIAFAKSAQKGEVDQYVCNKKEYGTLLHFPTTEISLEEEVKQVKAIFEKQTSF